MSACLWQVHTDTHYSQLRCNLRYCPSGTAMHGRNLGERLLMAGECRTYRLGPPEAPRYIHMQARRSTTSMPVLSHAILRHDNSCMHTCAVHSGNRCCIQVLALAACLVWSDFAGYGASLVAACKAGCSPLAHLYVIKSETLALVDCQRPCELQWDLRTKHMRSNL